MARTGFVSNYTTASPSLYENFATIGDWTAGGSTGSTATADTTNLDGYSAALKLDVASTAGGNAFATKNISTNFDISGIYTMTFRVYVPDYTTVSSVAIYISSSAGFASYMLATVSAGFVNGWNTMTLHRSNFSATGGELWSNTMIRLRVRLNAVASTLPKITFASMKTGGKYYPNILFTFDDAFSTVYTVAYPYMSARGIVGTIYVNGSSIDTAGYCTLAQLTEMQSAGWAICDHVYTHTNLTTVDAAAQRSLLQQNRNYLTTNGFTKGMEHLAYPNGGYNDSIIALVQSMGYKTARSIVEWTNRSQHYPIDSMWQLKMGNCLDSTTSSTIIGWMQDTYAKGGTLILLYHKLVTPATVSTEHPVASFQAEVDAAYLYKSQGLLTDKTIVSWYNGLTGGRI